jgi:nucleotide-binding universal stress UspA family protein
MRIVVPFDGSSASRRAVDYATRIAGSVGKESVTVHLLNVQDADAPVMDVFSRDAADVAARVATSRREAGAKLLGEASEALDKVGVQSQSTVLLGDPAAVIASYVDNHRCDMVVMGTRGLGPVGGLILGSVAFKVIHLVKVPVTLVK